MTTTSKELELAITKEVERIQSLKGKNLLSPKEIGTALIAIIVNHKPKVPGYYDSKVKRMISAGENTVYNKVWPQVLKLNGKEVAYSTKYVDGRNIVGLARMLNFIDYCLGKR